MTGIDAMNCNNEPGRVLDAGLGRSTLTKMIFDDGQERDPVEKVLKDTGRRVDLSIPFEQPSQHAQASSQQPAASRQQLARAALS